MANKLFKIGIEYLLIPLAQALFFSISFFILFSIIMAPLSLYMGAVDGLWNYQRSINVAIGLPSLTLAIFHFSKIRQSILVKIWGKYFSINVKPS